MTYLDDIHDFHTKFELPQVEKPGPLSAELTEFRIKFMQEELDEFKKAYEQNDLPGMLDALVDLTYVVLGTAWMMNLPFNEAWALVHEANMKKVRAQSQEESKRASSADVVKPPGWVAPDLSTLLPITCE